MLLQFVLLVWGASVALVLWVAYCMHVARAQTLHYAAQLTKALEKRDLITAKECATRMRDALTF